MQLAQIMVSIHTQSNAVVVKVVVDDNERLMNVDRTSLPPAEHIQFSSYCLWFGSFRDLYGRLSTLRRSVRVALLVISADSCSCLISLFLVPDKARKYS